MIEFFKFRTEGMRSKIPYEDYNKLSDEDKNQGIIYHGELNTK